MGSLPAGSLAGVWLEGASLPGWLRPEDVDGWKRHAYLLSRVPRCGKCPQKKALEDRIKACQAPEKATP